MHVILFGKGKKECIVSIHEKLCVVLLAYMKDKGIDENMVGKDALFTNTHGRTLTTAGLTHIININMYTSLVRTQYPELLPEKISPHTFRHSKAMHLLQAGVNLVYICDLMGHISIQTMEICARAYSKAKREAIETAYQPSIPEIDVTEKIWKKDKEIIAFLKSLI